MALFSLMGLSILLPLVLGIPIAVSLGAAGVAWLVALDPERLIYLKGVANALWNTADNYTLMSVPLFILMGELMQRSDVSRRFYFAVSHFLRWLPGGALHSNIAACAVLSAVSGSSVATAAMVGAAAIPSLMQLRYDRRMIFGTLAAGGTLGVLIPPSIPLIIYAALVEESVGRLFLAAVVPGVLMTAIFILYVLWRNWGLRRDDAQTLGYGDVSNLALLVDIMPFAAILTCILGGLYLGWATPTEVAGLGAAVALATAAAYGNLNLRLIRESVVSTVRVTATIMFVVIGAQIFSYALFSWGVTHAVSEWTSGLEVAPIVVLLGLIVMYLILGMFIDPISMMVLTLGVVFPVIVSLGYDPIWFGVLLVLLIEIGLITPPVGINLFTIQSIVPGLTTVGEVARGAFPFVLLLLLGIALIVAFPEIVLWLPRMAYE